MNEKMQYMKYYTEAGIKYVLHRNDPNYSYLGEREQELGLLDIAQTSDYLYKKIQSGDPFVATRFGSVELGTLLKTIEVNLNIRKKVPERNMNEMNNNAGFFPKSQDALMKYGGCIEKLLPHIDLLALWNKKVMMEKYVVDKLVHGKTYCTMNCLEPFWAEKPWSLALEGKTVLVIHPFANTITRQYSHKENLFDNPDVLPDFNLKCVKAVQTIAGNSDDRFKTWFDAFDYMYEEALKTDFDVALIGCGAYGMPLAIKLKMAGKQAIHIGGALQLLFGIKGSRWESRDKYKNIIKDTWVRVSEDEIPIGARKVENGCYW